MFYKLRALYMNGIYKYTEFCKTVINIEVSVFISLGQSHVTSFTFIMSYVMNEPTQLMWSVHTKLWHGFSVSLNKLLHFEFILFDKF